jgi:hypothetical protein
MALCGAPQKRSDMTGVSGGPGPVDLTSAVQLRQYCLVQLLPDASLLPLPQAPPAGHPRAVAKLGGKVAPGDPCVQDEEDPVQRCPVVQALSTGIAVSTLSYGQQWLQLGPKALVYLKA